MNCDQIFTLGLGIKEPWIIKEVELKKVMANYELHIEIDFEKGTKFLDEVGELCQVHDTKQKVWRHLNFFQHECYLHCRVPRIKTKEGKVKLVEVPWARIGSGFTLLFESYVMMLIEAEMPVNNVGQLVGEYPHRIWTIFNYWINRAYIDDQPSTPKRLGFDETSQRKGHKYITCAVDIARSKVLHVTEGKDSSTIQSAKEHLKSKGINTEKVEHISIDMSKSFIAGINAYFPNAEIHFDRFHVVKLLNEAMDEVRRTERKEHNELKGHKYTFLKDKNNLSNKRKQELSELITLFPTLGDAYRLKELFQDLWEMETEEEATAFLVDWCKQVEQSGIEPFKKFTKTIKAHWTGIVNFCETEINNGILEGINSKIQLAKRRARGFRCVKNLINMIYLLCGKLKFNYPLIST